MRGPPRGAAPPPPPGRSRSTADVKIDQSRSLSQIEPSAGGGLPRANTDVRSLGAKPPSQPPPIPSPEPASLSAVSAAAQPLATEPPPAVPAQPASYQIPMPPQKENETKAEKRLRMRINVVNELVATEETYVRQLNQLIQEYVDPLRSNRLITPDQHAGLFPDITVIVNLNENFLASLKDKQLQWDNETSLIGDEFLSFAPFFKMYQNYVNNHERASKIQRTLLGNAEFQAFCEESKASTSGLDLQSLLILPIQRVPRYELCLRELLKNTSERHVDYANLDEAMGMVREVNAIINERMKEYDAREQVREVERRIGGGIELVAPARRFVREGELWKVCRKKDRRYLFFLFTDMILYCSYSTGEGLKLHNQLPFNAVFEVVDIESSTKYGDRCFELHSSVKSFLVYGDDHGHKMEWMDEINRVFQDNRILKQRGSITGNELRPAPIWFPDDFSDSCMICKAKFSVFRRRHHCRYCGKLICNDCSPMKLPNFNGNTSEAVRVCNSCFDRFKHMYPEAITKLRTGSFSGRKFLSARGNGASPRSPSASHSGEEDSDPELEYDSDEESMSIKSDDMKVVETPKRAPAKRGRFGTDISTMNRVPPTRNGTTTSPRGPAPSRPSERRKPSIGAPSGSPVLSASTSQDFGDDANRQIAFLQNELESHKNTMEVMKTKVDNFRRQNERKQQRIQNLEEENRRLRKSKVDLVTQKTAEINRLKKRIKQLETQLGIEGNNY